MRKTLLIGLCLLIACQGQHLAKEEEAADAKTEEKSNDKYEILGVPGDADAKVIRRAYRKIIVDFHPDRLKGLSEEEKAEKDIEYKRINLAFRTLIDPEKRKIYDETGSDGTSDENAGPVYTRNVDTEYMTYIWLVMLFFCGWYPLFILDDSHKKRKKKRIPKKNQPKESFIDSWFDYMFNLNQGQQVFVMICGCILIVYSGVMAPKISKGERVYYKNMNEAIQFLEREPVDYLKAQEKFEAAVEEEWGQRRPLPYLLWGQAAMELGDKGKCMELLTQAMAKLPDPKKEDLDDRPGTEAFMANAFRKIYDYDDEEGLADKDKFEEQALTLIAAADKKYKRKDPYLMKVLEKLKNSILGASAHSGGGDDEEDFDAEKPDMSAMMDEDEDDQDSEERKDQEADSRSGDGADAPKEPKEPPKPKFDKTGAGAVDVSDVAVDDW